MHTVVLNNNMAFADVRIVYVGLPQCWSQGMFCQHLRVHQPGEVALRMQHLGLLQRIDPSCPEVVEMVELGLNIGVQCLPQHT